MKNYYAFICVRDLQINNITEKLFSYLSSAGVKIKLLPDRKSIFSAYSEALERINPEDEDVVILCHDDLEILTPVEKFRDIIDTGLSGRSGFVGPAGTTHLGTDAVWWDWNRQRQGLHRGQVWHFDALNTPVPTHYGPQGEVVALDGLFLAAKAGTLRAVGLEKPEYFEGEWDFYDIHYTTKAHGMGLINQTVPIYLMHHSKGELVGRDSWHKNREAFCKVTKLPYLLS